MALYAHAVVSTDLFRTLHHQAQFLLHSFVVC